ncbi:MAG: ABC transporter substrate-binding protein [Chloroflexota bacterium]
MLRRTWSVISLVLVGTLVAACGGAATSPPTSAPSAKEAPPVAKDAAPKAAAPDAAKPAAPAKDAVSGVDPEWQKILDAAKQEGTVLVYGQGFMRGAEGQMIAQEFQKQTGVKIDLVEISGGSASYQRIREEMRANTPTADVFLGAPPFPGIMEKDGVAMVVKDKPLPIFKEPKANWRVDPLAMSDTGSYLINYPSYPSGHVMINTRLLPPADYPTSYMQLSTDPKYKGKIAWVDPKTTADVPSKYIFWGYTGGGLTAEAVWNIYANQQPLLYPNPQPEADAVARGEAAIAMGLAGFETAAEAGAPLKVLRFSGYPAVTNINGMVIFKAARRPNASLVLANWIMSKEGHEYMVKVRKTISLRTDVPDQLPESIAKPELVGGSDRAQTFIVSGPQANLNTDLAALDFWPRLVNGAIGKEEFIGLVNAAVQDWESKNGGPQKAIPLKD